MYVCICAYVYIYIYIYIHTYTTTEEVPAELFDILGGGLGKASICP